MRKWDYSTEALSRIKSKANFDIARIDEIEKVVKHDVIAFLTSVADYIGEDSGYLHLGLTSSDVLDTSFAMLLRESSDLIIEGIIRLMEAIKKRAFEHKNTPMIGRSHGFTPSRSRSALNGFWYDEMRRNLRRMEAARETISYGKISGRSALLPISTRKWKSTYAQKQVSNRLLLYAGHSA
jgi:adenylosuccinate lyase